MSIEPQIAIDKVASRLEHAKQFGGQYVFHQDLSVVACGNEPLAPFHYFDLIFLAIRDDFLEDGFNQLFESFVLRINQNQSIVRKQGCHDLTESPSKAVSWIIRSGKYGCDLLSKFRVRQRL